jgi:threonine dehydrogenase-like Zn-dependent dehydrogenase
MELPHSQTTSHRSLSPLKGCGTCFAESAKHLRRYFDGFMPTMKSGDIMGHEFMGEVVGVGAENKALKVGDRVVVPFSIFCGGRDECKRGNFSGSSAVP